MATVWLPSPLLLLGGVDQLVADSHEKDINAKMAQPASKQGALVSIDEGPDESTDGNATGQKDGERSGKKLEGDDEMVGGEGKGRDSVGCRGGQPSLQLPKDEAPPVELLKGRVKERDENSEEEIVLRKAKSTYLLPHRSRAIPDHRANRGGHEEHT